MIRVILPTLALIAIPLHALGADPQTQPAPGNYVRPFEPPTRAAFIPLPPGAVEPTGWLRDWATTARDGYTGHMDEVDNAFKQAWATDYKMTGDQLTFWDRGAWPYEGGGYWFDGLNKLAYCLHDQTLIDMVRARFSPALDNANPDGILFMWWLKRSNPADMEAVIRHAGGEANAWPVWANALFGRALTGYYPASGDKRVLNALDIAYGGDRFWLRREAPPTNLWPAFEAYTWTGHPQIRQALTDFFNTYKIEDPDPAKPVKMIEAWYNRWPDPTRPSYRQPNHGVVFNEFSIPWAVGYLWTGDRKYLDAPLKWYEIFERGDDGMQPHGVPTFDENSGPTGSLRGTETCSVSGFIWSQITLLRVSGQGLLADRAERAFFNAAANTVARDFKTGVYHQTPNRMVRGVPADGPFLYNQTQFPLCCTAAANRFLPNYIVHMWMATYDDGLAFTCYGPNRVSALVADHVPIDIECRTDYPFNETIDLTVRPAREATFPLSFRIPDWCADPQLVVNNAPQPVTRNGNGFVRIERLWKPGDTVALRFPMTPVVKTGRDNNADDTPYATVSYGPLLFVLGLPDAGDPNTPVEGSKWNYALDTPGNAPAFGITVERRPMPEKWSWPLDSPLRLRVQAQAFDWKPTPRKALETNPVGPNDASPFQPDTIITQLPPDAVAAEGAGEELALVPYGCAKFRLTMFPVTQRALKTLEPAGPPPFKREKSAFHREGT